ncbi:MAG: SH3 domain-containing protein [Pirellulales bacterium]|nr:SH3 domain-containing protein [Pirellulales bacterium]
MHTIVAAFLCSHALLAYPAGGDQGFPYKAYVTADDVYVRSGPGHNYYPTDKLRRGQAVEVYRHDPGGWCAVRPVEGSFTWVSGRFLQPTEGNLAVVSDEGVSARVGSRFSNVRDVIQVRLHKGELVEIVEAPREGDIWYKIAPPSGEFRWISGKYLDAEYPHDGLARRDSTDEPAGGASEDRRMRESDFPPPSRESLQTKSAQLRALTPEEFKRELESIELELSIMVIEEPTVWSFFELKERTNVLLDHAQTAVERGRARLLAKRIVRFEDIKQRQADVLAMRERTDRDSRMWSRLRPSDAEESSAPALTDDRFDGRGRLMRVVSPKLGAPRYALMDDGEEVVCYVTPAPGVNLHDYIGREVGVTGTRGYMPEQRVGHIMARHVAPLDGRMLR